MKKEEFIQAVTGLVWVYINNEDLQGRNAQITVNPELLYVDLITEEAFQDALLFNQEVIENAAYAHDAAQYEAEDYQAQQNREFYPAWKLVRQDAEGKTVPDEAAIGEMAANYFPHNDTEGEA